MSVPTITYSSASPPPHLEVDRRLLEPPPKTAVLGVPLALTDYERTMDWMDATVASGGRGYICVAATHTVMACQEDPELREAVLASDLTVPDGQPLVWALAALGDRLASRVYGPDLMAHYCARAERTGARIFLYGGRDAAGLELLTRKLRERFPALRIVGGHPPLYRTLTEAEAAEVADIIDAADADVVWVGLGVPRQEKFMHAMRDRLQVPVMVGVGAAFDFHSGLVRQAPGWMQRVGLEWLFRLSQEPRRLWRRYARYNPRFVVGFARQWSRVQRARA